MWATRWRRRVVAAAVEARKPDKELTQHHWRRHVQKRHLHAHRSAPQHYK